MNQNRNHWHRPTAGQTPRYSRTSSRRHQAPIGRGTLISRILRSLAP